MRSYIIDPFKKTIEQIELPNQEKARLNRIDEILDYEERFMTFIYPEEYTTCTAYVNYPKKGIPFFRVKGFVNKVRFGMAVVIDKTATGFPKSDNITLEELTPMITFFP